MFGLISTMISSRSLLQIFRLHIYDTNLPFPPQLPKVLYWLRSGDCGGHLSKVNSLSCSRNRLRWFVPIFLPPFWCSIELQQVVFTTSRCLNALSCCHVIGWLAICVANQFEQVYLIKWPVSIYYTDTNKYESGWIWIWMQF